MAKLSQKKWFLAGACLLVGLVGILPTHAANAELEALRQRKAQLVSEVAYVQSKIDYVNAKTVGDSAGKWQAEMGAWQTKLTEAKTELDQILQKEATLTGKAVPGATEATVTAGDVLEVFVNEDPSFNGVYQVRRGGYIVVPRLGRIQVGGLPVAAAEAAVKGRLEVDLLRNATVMVERSVPAGLPISQPEAPGVILDGEFVEEGVTTLRGVGGASLVSTILRAGGETPYADLQNVRVLRLIDGKPLVENVNVSAILEGDELASDLTLSEDDIIIIPTKVGQTHSVYVSGKVQNPGMVEMPRQENLTVYSAILRSGGPARFANMKKIFVLRELGDGIKSRMEVNLKDVKKGNAPDVVLEDGDIIVVPEAFFSF